jgi:NAD(P)-dependent dehydrogenase (short-subunit alcohol dehydrogenase family)
MSKTILVTGAGIDRDAALVLAARGHRVIAATCTEARRPRLRYVAPWVQGFVVRLARMFGV